jgi:hypothetical protein
VKLTPKQVRKVVVGEINHSRKKAQQAISTPFFVAPCSVGVPSGCGPRSSGFMVTIIMLKSVGQ